MKNKIKNNQKKKLSIIFNVILITVMFVSGCGINDEKEYKDEYVPMQTVIEEQTDNGYLNEETKNNETEDKITDNQEIENKTEDNQEIENHSNENQITNNNEIKNMSNNEIIGGKVRSIGDNSFVISRTLIDEDGCVTMPEKGSAEEELINIICMNETVFEYWTIQGGGAGIEKSEADFTDITEDGGLEAEGYFDGENFMANKVIIEVYK